MPDTSLPQRPAAPMLNAAAAGLAGQFRRARLSAEAVALSVAAIDAAMLGLLGWFGAYALWPPAEFAAWHAAGGAAAAAALAVALLAYGGGYRLRHLRSLCAQAWRLILCALPPLAAVLVATRPPEMSPGSVAALAAGLLSLPLALRGLCLVPAIRWAVEAGLTERRAVLVGGGDPAHDLITGLRGNPGNRIRICAIFDDRSDARSPDLVLDVPKIGRFDDLLGFARRAEIDMVIIALPLEATDRIAFLLDKFEVLPLPVHLAQFSKDYAFDDTVPSPGQARLSLLEAGSFGLRRRMLKRLFDVTIASLALVVLSPLLALIALAIRLDSPGPVLFRQMRSGFNEREVAVFKFRSMRADRCDLQARQIVVKNDPRVTRVGAVLRRTSLDELPQLFNVLRGELSLVGPRPHAVDAVTGRKEAFAELVAGYSARHRLPPGITGWAQIHGARGGIEDPEALRRRVAYDLWYIENWSPWLDLRILLATPVALLDTRNAY